MPAEKEFFMSNALVHLQQHVVDAVQGRKERGATMVEYALLVGLIALVAIGGVTIFGSDLSVFFTSLSGKI